LIVTTSSLSPGARDVRTARGYPVNAADRETLRTWVTADARRGDLPPSKDLDICVYSIGEDGVQEDEVGFHLFGEVEGLHAPLGGEHLEAVVRELLLEVGPHGTLVLDQ
jgi:hypothetical protein